MFKSIVEFWKSETEAKVVVLLVSMLLLVSMSFFVSFFGVPFGVNKHHGGGDVRGIVTDVWVEGTLFKTNEVRMITEGGATVVHRFSIENLYILDQLRKVSKERKSVIIRYRTYLIKPFLTKCNDIVIGVDVLDEKRNE